eukprot:243023-Chlamydomonas_euryale.AAC.2
MSKLLSLVNAVSRHQLPTARDEMTPALAIASLDLSCGSISREALWGVLKLYGEPARDQITRSAHQH